MSSLSALEIEEILNAAMPDECELAGDEHVALAARTAANGGRVTAPTPSQLGYRISPEAAMLAIAAGANFIKACIDIYFLLANRNHTKPKRSEFSEKALSQGAEVGGKAAELAASVFKVLEHSTGK
jgi:hypothetical protein